MTTAISSPTTCQSCRAPIIWATTANGKPGPFEEDPAGSWIIDNGIARYAGKVEVGPQRVLELDVPRKRYTSHFATCPDAVSWRQRA